MTANVQKADDRLWSWFRRAMWAGAAFLLLLPFVAMRFADEVNWTVSDFIFAAVLLFGSAGIIDLVARANASLAYRAGVVVAVGTIFLTIWANGAIGMIGNEDNPYNLWFGGVIVLALIGAGAARLRADGMAVAMSLAAGVQALVGALGMAADLRGGIFSIAFAGLWILAAVLFRKAGREHASEGIGREV